MSEHTFFQNNAALELRICEATHRWALVASLISTQQSVPIPTDDVLKLGRRASEYLAVVPRLRAGLAWLSDVESGAVTPTSPTQHAKSVAWCLKQLAEGVGIRDDVVNLVDEMNDYLTLLDALHAAKQPTVSA